MASGARSAVRGLRSPVIIKSVIKTSNLEFSLGYGAILRAFRLSCKGPLIVALVSRPDVKKQSRGLHTAPLLLLLQYFALITLLWLGLWIHLVGTQQGSYCKQVVAW